MQIEAINENKVGFVMEFKDDEIIYCMCCNSPLYGIYDENLRNYCYNCQKEYNLP